jgi:hypothetical protein
VLPLRVDALHHACKPALQSRALGGIEGREYLL